MVKITVSSDNFEAIKNLRPGDSLVVGHVNHSNEVITMERGQEYNLSNICVWKENAGNYRTQCGITIDGDFFNVARGDKLSFCPGCGKRIFEED